MNTKYTKTGWMMSAIVTSLLLLGCGNGDSGSDTPPVNTADVNSYIYDLPTWTDYSPPSAFSDAPTDEGPSLPFQEIHENKEYSCTTTPYSITNTPDRIVMFSPNASVMWLGNLLQGSGYKEGLGSLQEWSIRERAPLRISIDLLTGDNYKMIEHPTLTTVQSAIGELIQRATDAGHEAGTDASYEQITSHSLSQAALRLGFSAHYLGAEASADLAVEHMGEERTIMAYFVQKMFTVSVELPSTPQQFFSDDFTQAQLQEQIDAGNIGPDNLPVYIANVAYGRILMFSFTSNHTEDRIRAAISASYDGLSGGGGGYTETELRDTLSTAKIKLTTMGGNDAAVTALIRDGKLASYFSEDTKLTSARPISYQLNNLGDNSIAKVSVTSEYNIKQCTEVPTPPPAPIGQRLEVKLHDVYIPADCDGGIDPGDIFGWFRVEGASTYYRSRTNATPIASGGKLILDKNKTVDFYYDKGQRIYIEGRLTDKDSGLNGNDDTVGTWGFYVTPSDSNIGRGSLYYRGSGNCSGGSSNQARLRYELRRLEYLY